MSRLASVLTALWAGSLWTICALVAPTVFATLDDRHLAGQVVAALFRIEAWLGTVIGAVLIAVAAARRTGVTPGRGRGVWLVVFTAGAPLLSELAIAPMMDAARAANDMARFGMLHGVSAALFLAACLGALALVWRISPPAG